MRGSHIDTPLVTVVMTCYNSSKTIVRAIESVNQQLYKNIELIVVDDASSDQTLELVQRCKEKWSSNPSTSHARHLRIFTSKKNYGTYVCRNYAIKRVRGAYITFHDSDDISTPFYVTKLVDRLKKDRNAKISVCLTNARAGRLSKPVICAPSTCFRSSLIKQLGYFDSVRFGADSEFRKRCEARYGNKSISIVGEKLYVTRSSKNSLTSNAKTGVYSNARKSYYNAFRGYHHKSTNSKQKRELLKYAFPMRDRPFAIPTICGQTDVTLSDFYDPCVKPRGLVKNHDLENKVISVLMGAYQSQKFIEMSVWSVLDQKLPEGWTLEFIVGVDGCKETHATVQKISDPRFGVVAFPENHGTYKVFNSIFSLSTGCLVMRFDSDDIMSEGLLDEMISLFINNPAYHWVGTRCARINERGRRIGHFDKNVIHIGQRMWRRKTWVEKIGAYESWVCAADAEVLARAELAHSIKCIPVKNSFLCYRKHSSSLVNSPETNMRSELRAGYHKIINERKSQYKSMFSRPLVPEISTDYIKSGMLFYASHDDVSVIPEQVDAQINSIRRRCWIWFNKVHGPASKLA